MKTKPNRNKKVYDVTFKQMFKTSYGLKFMLDNEASESEWYFNGADIRCHLLNIGCIIYVFDEMDKALYICDACSNECFDIYEMVEKGLCK